MCVLALCNNVSVALGTLYEAQPMFMYNQAINLHHVRSILQALRSYLYVYSVNKDSLNAIRKGLYTFLKL